ncbi:hypothetical protein FOL47_001026 [Perkinsus chesapeaki]|uniref:Uncharacterized protein n=1 Tax=Perkinsus chesapeaki TaxID=330153 RepID=A0A7J6MKJ7_PERCH|nr:hypothetical protein FOL47_001026 [Perkinsus chesapeaki]
MPVHQSEILLDEDAVAESPKKSYQTLRSRIKRIVLWHNEEWKGMRLPGAALFFFKFFFLGFAIAPPDVSRDAWWGVTLTACTCMGSAMLPLPLPAFCVFVLALAGLSGGMTSEEIVSGFGSPDLWFNMFSFMTMRAFTVTGLGKRLGLTVYKYLGFNVLLVAYVICIIELILSLFITSPAVRGVGLIMPVLVPLLEHGFKSLPEEGTEREVGSYLVLVEITANAFVSACWFTGYNDVNDYIASYLNDNGINADFNFWATQVSIPVIFAVLLVPLMVYLLHRPKYVRNPKAHQDACKRLRQLGNVSCPEVIVAVVYVATLALWIAASMSPGFYISDMVIAAIGIAALLAVGIIDSDSAILDDKRPFRMLIYYGTLLSVIQNCVSKGYWSYPFARKYVVEWLDGLPVGSSLLLGTFVMYFTSYLYTSPLAHAKDFYPPIFESMMLNSVPSHLGSSAISYVTMARNLSPYTSPTNPAYYALEYVTARQWWFCGVASLALNYLFLISVGFLWWLILGDW